MKGQRGRILSALLRGERLTRIEALNKYGVGRLSARIDEISKAVEIKRGWRSVPTAWSDKDTRLREYWIAREQEV